MTIFSLDFFLLCVWLLQAGTSLVGFLWFWSAECVWGGETLLVWLRNLSVLVLRVFFEKAQFAFLPVSVSMTTVDWVWVKNFYMARTIYSAALGSRYDGVCCIVECKRGVWPRDLHFGVGNF